ncbi:MAG: heme-copper oxidase subunit III [Pyrinomonadaceae bacterium]
MKIGVVEPVEDAVPPKRKRSRRSGGGSNRPSGGNNGGNDDNGGGGSGGGFDKHNQDDFQQSVPNKAKVVTWFLLLVVLMTFGGLIGAYMVVSTNGVAEWRPFDLPIQVWLSTVIILASSATYHVAQLAIESNYHQKLRRFLLATTVLGAAFIASQIVVWLELINRGYYMSGNPYAGFFYIITGIHAVHVLGGIIALGAISLRTANQTEYGPELEYRRNLARSVGWYWHFIGVLWIVLFIMLGFWK